MRYNLKDIKLFGYHGVHEIEKINGQNFNISISYLDNTIKSETDILQKDDNVANYINYIDIYSVVEKVFNEKRYNLIETLASEIYINLLKKYNIDDLQIKITKKISYEKHNINEITFTFKK